MEVVSGHWGIAALAAAYLFVASEEESHLAVIEFVLVLGVVWLAAAVSIMFFAVLIALARWGDR